MNREQLLKKIIKEAGSETLKLFGKIGVKYTKKHEADVVTEADIISHNIITKAIKKYFPEDGIISEEDKKYKPNAEYVWIIDPVDGTRNYSKGTPIYCVLIGITRKGKVILGSINLPALKEFYFAAQGKGAYKNGKRIRCSTQDHFSRSFGSGQTSIAGQNSSPSKKLMLAEKEYKYWVLFSACAGFDAALAATGRSDWYFTPYCGSVWDFAGPYIILKEAGCKVTNLKGEEWSLKDNEMLAANPKLHNEIMKIIR